MAQVRKKNYLCEEIFNAKLFTCLTMTIATPTYDAALTRRREKERAARFFTGARPSRAAGA
jgi:hypothetical protein